MLSSTAAKQTSQSRSQSQCFDAVGWATEGCKLQFHIHVVNECPGSKLHDGGLQRLHSVNNIAVNWLEGMVVKAPAIPKGIFGVPG